MPTSTDEALGARRRDARLHAGFDSVEQLAASAGVSHNTVRNYERGGNIRGANQRAIEDAIQRGGDEPSMREVMAELQQAHRDAIRQRGQLRETLDALIRRLDENHALMEHLAARIDVAPEFDRRSGGDRRERAHNDGNGPA